MQRDDGHAATWTRDRVLFAAAELLFVIATLAMLFSGAITLVGCGGGEGPHETSDAGARTDARAQLAEGAPDAGSGDAGSDAGSGDAGSDAGSGDAGS
ncbi:MAG: hypothetical protein K8H88_34425, partial [Sandaracinaceae bacterium]|nr:hypothetical protein [Sandaracinaceae bacterium]